VDILRGGSYYKEKAKEKERFKEAKENSKQRHKENTKASIRRKAHQGKGCLTSRG
jgi:hypothetical protein